MKASPVLKIFSAALSVVYFTTQCALLQAGETQVWAERRRARSVPDVTRTAALPSFFDPVSLPSPAASFINKTSRTRFDGVKNPDGRVLLARIMAELPPQAGSVRAIRLPADGVVRRVAIHIQDVHLNAEAQKNISDTIARLLSKNKIDALGLEGTFSDLAAPFANRHPGDLVYEKAVAYALKRNDISGPVHAALLTSATLPVIAGIDDRAHYEKNVAAVREGVPAAAEANKTLNQMDAALTEKERVALNPALASLENTVRSYRRGTTPLSSYAEALAQNVPSIPATAQKFLEALHLEKQMDFARAEKERADILSRLTARLNHAQLSDLLNATVAFRTGAMRQSDFYAHLDTIARTAGVRLSASPMLNAYIRYALLADTLQTETLFNDLHAMEKQALTGLARTGEEKTLIAEAERIDLTRKLVNFSMTREEWGGYEKENPNHKAQNPNKFILDFGLGHLDLRPFESFYAEAEARDHAMASNVVSLFDRTHAVTAVIVTGGFHEPGMARELNAKGIATISFVPTVTRVETAGGAVNLSVFTREKAPLEKLFAGERLSVSPDPMGGAEKIGFNCVAAEERLQLHPESDAPATLKRYEVPSSPHVELRVDVETNGKPSKGDIVVKIHSPNGDVVNATYQVAENGTIEGDREDVPAIEQTIRKIGEEMKFSNLDIERLIKPSNVVSFPVVFVVDGVIELGREVLELIEYPGYRVLNGYGSDPHKGGIRFDITATLRELYTLSLGMRWKVLYYNLPYLGGKGGVALNPKNYTYAAQCRAMRSYARGWFASNLNDIPAPDMGTLELIAVFLDEIIRQTAARNRDFQREWFPGFEIYLIDPPATPDKWARADWEYPGRGSGTPFYDRYQKIHHLLPPEFAFLHALVTGKPVDKMGLSMRPPATGFGVSVVTREAVHYYAKRLGWDSGSLKGKRVAIQGWGNVATWTAHFLTKMGAIVVGIGEVKGVITNPDGLDIEALIAHSENRRRQSRQNHPFEGFEQSGTYFDKDKPGIEVLYMKDVDILIPAASGNQLDGETMRHVMPKVVIVEGANDPTTKDGDAVNDAEGPERKRVIVPDFMANGGGVFASLLENRNDKNLLPDTQDKTIQTILDKHMSAIVNETFRRADEAGVSLRTQASRDIVKKAWEGLSQENPSANATPPSPGSSSDPASRTLSSFEILARGGEPTVEERKILLETVRDLLAGSAVSRDVGMDDVVAISDPNLRMAMMTGFRDRLKTDPEFRRAAQASAREKKLSRDDLRSFFTAAVVNGATTVQLPEILNEHQATPKDATVVPLGTDQWKALNDHDRLALLTALERHHRGEGNRLLGKVIIALDDNAIRSDVKTWVAKVEKVDPQDPKGQVMEVISTAGIFSRENGPLMLDVPQLEWSLMQARQLGLTRVDMSNFDRVELLAPHDSALLLEGASDLFRQAVVLWINDILETVRITDPEIIEEAARLINSNA